MKNVSPVVAIVAGILVLLFPSFLQWVVGIFLLVFGIMGFMGKK